MRLFIAAALLLAATYSYAQQPYEVIRNGNTVLLKGLISRNLLVSDSSFAWFTKGQTDYNPNAATVETLKKNKDSLQFLVFGGTWCGDTRHILPRFYKTLDAAGIPDDKVTLFAVDYAKKTIGHITDVFDIRFVPTIIVLKEGKEIARVVEYGKTGVWDKELGDLIKAAE